MILLDTNILVYAADHTASFHHEAKSFRDQAAQGRQPACLSPTILTEFYAIITDGKRVEHPLVPQVALNELRTYRNVFSIIHPGTMALDYLQDLIERYGIERQQVFDAWIVATMLEHGVDTIYTANVKHFGKFREIQVKSPAQ